MNRVSRLLALVGVVGLDGRAWVHRARRHDFRQVEPGGRLRRGADLRVRRLASGEAQILQVGIPTEFLAMSPYLKE